MKTDRRDIPVETELLEHIANCTDGGSGEGSYTSGRIQSMAREILKYRKQCKNNIAYAVGAFDHRNT